MIIHFNLENNSFCCCKTDAGLRHLKCEQVAPMSLRVAGRVSQGKTQRYRRSSIHNSLLPWLPNWGGHTVASMCFTCSAQQCEVTNAAQGVCAYICFYWKHGWLNTEYTQSSKEISVSFFLWAFFLLVCFLPLKKRGAGNQINLLSGFILLLKLILCRRVIRGTSQWRKNLSRPCRPTLTFQIHRPSVTASLLAHASDCTVYSLLTVKYLSINPVCKGSQDMQNLCNCHGDRCAFVSVYSTWNSDKNKTNRKKNGVETLCTQCHIQ